MTVQDIVEKLGLKVCSGANGLNREIEGGYTSDLLSDVMGNADENHIWVTLQTHKNIMAIASLKELAAIVLVKGYEPEEDAAEQSNEEGIPILSSEEEAFELTGKLFEIINQAK
ncbi:DRTGG domain-containing protein [Marinifilum caeruleilacunae]|jgi:serine kinase of HPr protein (carbohydrate metabolism regulator)|uniref:Serine kinase n=1 Tax=Marinifilum caeruleilacunae TaxID=2499076 RepID=A0ABX1WTZ3_9BACT|nr:DRTGG domain-containing protein [Marinifilum caeruleilacunae]NOU59579.1 serine kinase [Marinifilum caeruleilacunae]